jgi:hypothetical protein
VPLSRKGRTKRPVHLPGINHRRIARQTSDLVFVRFHLELSFKCHPTNAPLDLAIKFAEEVGLSTGHVKHLRFVCDQPKDNSSYDFFLPAALHQWQHAIVLFLVRRSHLRSYDEALRFVPFYISNPRNHRMKYMSELTFRTDRRGEARQVVPKARRGTTNKTVVICYGALFP